MSRQARLAAGSWTTGWVDALHVLRRSEAALLDLTGRSSGLSWMTASVMFSVVSSTVPRVDVIEDVDFTKFVVRNMSCQHEVKSLSDFVQVISWHMAGPLTSLAVTTGSFYCSS
jgi:hypothetical protein